MKASNTQIQFSRRDYKGVLATYAKPKMLVATKPNAASEAVWYGKRASLLHNFWIIRSEDPSKVLGADQPIDFAQPIHVGGVKLTDAPLLHDLLTAKVLVLELMRGQYFEICASNYIYREFLQLMWVFRWRLNQGIDRIRHIPPELFDDFCERLALGVPSLISLEGRIERIKTCLQDGNLSAQVEETPRGKTLKLAEVASELGVQPEFLRKNSLRNSLTELMSITAAVPRVRKAAAGSDSNRDRPTYTLTMKTLVPWSRLHILSRVGLLAHDPLAFDPFANVSLGARVRQVGRPFSNSEGRTETPPPEKWLELLDGAAKWLLDYAEPVLRVCEKAREARIAVLSDHTVRGTRERQLILQSAVQRIIDENMPAGRFTGVRLAPIFRRVNSSLPGLSLEDALQHVVTACQVLIGAFSARRKRELESLHAGCAHRDTFKNWWLSSYIEKTIRDIVQIPVPANVGFSVQVLENLSLSARNYTGAPWLFQVYRPSVIPSDITDTPFEHLMITSSFGPRLKSFCETLGLSGPTCSEGWAFKPHQLRRAFAVYYYYGYRYSSLDALSRFLRHFDPEMTRRYLTEITANALARLKDLIEARHQLVEAVESSRQAALEREAQRALKSMEEASNDFEDVRRDAFVDRALEVYDGLERPVGRGAATLYAELEELISRAGERVRIAARGNGSPDEVRQALIKTLREFAASRYLEPHPGKHAHCGCNPNRPEHLANANCLNNKARIAGQSGSRADYAFASISDCLDCIHAVAFSENVAEIHRVIDQAQVAANRASSEPRRLAAKDKLAAFKEKLRSAERAVDGKSLS